MRVVILCARSGWHVEQLLSSLGELGHIAVTLPYEAAVARIGTRVQLTSEGAPLLDADAVIARIIPSGSLEQIIYRVDTLHWLEQRGVPVLNSPKTIERCVDKFYTTALLQQAGMDVPDTIVCERASDAVDAVRQFGTAIIKPLFGSMGLGMVRVDSSELAWRVARTLEQTRAVFYVQRYVPHHGYDIRVLVAGARVIGAITRSAAPGEWRTNIAQGGEAAPLALSEELARIAIRAAAAVQADYAGVDLLPALDGRTYALEVNAIPAWKGLQQATGIEVAPIVVRELLSRAVGRIGAQA